MITSCRFFHGKIDTSDRLFHGKIDAYKLQAVEFSKATLPLTNGTIFHDKITVTNDRLFHGEIDAYNRLTFPWQN